MLGVPAGKKTWSEKTHTTRQKLIGMFFLSALPGLSMSEAKNALVREEAVASAAAATAGVAAVAELDAMQDFAVAGPAWMEVSRTDAAREVDVPAVGLPIEDIKLPVTFSTAWKEENDVLRETVSKILAMCSVGSVESSGSLCKALRQIEMVTPMKAMKVDGQHLFASWSEIGGV